MQKSTTNLPKNTATDAVRLNVYPNDLWSMIPKNEGIMQKRSRRKTWIAAMIIALMLFGGTMYISFKERNERAMRVTLDAIATWARETVAVEATLTALYQQP